MLSPRTGTILKSVIEQYINKATPVPSQNIADSCNLKVSTATIRNEMAQLEDEGYITRPHPSAGCIPLDKGYRYYVQSLGDVRLPLAEQLLVSHLFHQVESELDEWLSLATTLIARMAQNVAVVTMPKPGACKFKHLELISLHDFLVLVILVLAGGKVRQHLITLDQIMLQQELTAIANKLSAVYAGLTTPEILAKDISLSSTEQPMADCLLKVMELEDNQEYEDSYFNGLYLTLNQPEFARNQRMTQTLMELVEQRNLLRSILPLELTTNSVKVIIGKENKKEAICDYSVVISQYGLPEEAVGTISVVGPTRMPYARTIAAVSYLASVLSRLAAKLYKIVPAEPNRDAAN